MAALGNITIANSVFKDNVGAKGAALYFKCDSAKFGVNSISNSIFTGNTARESGGAIYYDTFRPVMNDLVFSNNSAPYGNDIASYPVKIIRQGQAEEQIRIKNVASGIAVSEELTLILVDFDNQVASTLSKGSISVTPRISKTKVLGRNSESILNGTSTFKDIILIAKPGSENVEFSLNCNQIDKVAVTRQFGKGSSNYCIGTHSIQKPLLSTFRYGKPGEINDNYQGVVCGAGSYSLQWNSTECKACPNHASGLGGAQIYVYNGFWRSSTNSTDMIEGIREEACLGEYHPELTYPVKCQDGYDGVLGTDGIIEDDTKYEKLSNYEGAKCPQPLYNALRIIGLILLVGVFFVIIIVIGIRK